jgi:muramoyltetrapeptide carboxypeptidase LdcA involved in peptidoglycan recycling
LTNMIIPPKLHAGDTVAVIAPSSSLGTIDLATRTIAEARLRALGLNIVFGKHAEEMDDFGSSSVQSRIADLHAMFSDPRITAVFAARGGWSANQLLRTVDWELVRRNPKIFCGFSNITILANAIYAKTGLVTYYGPGFSTFGQARHFDYTLEYVKKCLMTAEPFNIEASRAWSDDDWKANQECREQIENDGLVALNEGAAEGIIVGGCLTDVTMLQGTEYMPRLEEAILFLEDDSASSPRVFDRALQSLLLQPGCSGIRGMVLGRFQKESAMTAGLLEQIIRSKRELVDIPVIVQADFGHTDPKITFPIGGIARVEAGNGEVAIRIMDH